MIEIQTALSELPNKLEVTNCPSSPQTEEAPHFMDWKRFHKILQPEQTEDQMWEIWLRTYHPGYKHFQPVEPMPTPDNQKIENVLPNFGFAFRP